MSFRDWQPRYAEHGIATFPVLISSACKKPMVSNYARFGLRASNEIAQRFPDATAFGFMAGERSRLTILDVDTPDDRVLAHALDWHGQTPIIVRSGSGNYQGWYRWNGEGRRIRPDPDRPIDILGGGFVVAPPSGGIKSDYEFIDGGLHDLDHLPHLRGLPPKIEKQTVTPPATELIGEGERNKKLWEHCMRSARHCDDFDSLLDVARTRNAEFSPPLTDSEVVKTAKSASDYTVRGENWIGTGRRVALHHATVDRLAAENPYALALLLVLKRHHWSREQFVVANEMAGMLGWSLSSFRAARKRLEDQGEIVCIQRGGRRRHDPSIYAWKFRSPKSDTNINLHPLCSALFASS